MVNHIVVCRHRLPRRNTASLRIVAVGLFMERERHAQSMHEPQWSGLGRDNAWSIKAFQPCRAPHGSCGARQVHSRVRPHSLAGASYAEGEGAQQASEFPESKS